MTRTLLAATLVAAMLSTHAVAGSEPDLLNWDNLVDFSAQDFEDPYRDVAPEQLSTLISMVRMQEQLEGGGVDNAARPRVEARIAQKRADLEAAGVDIAYLLEQRWVVAEKRRNAAVAVNPEVDGTSVQIGGFLIPAPPNDEGQPMAYLVPERGMCSHVPPPPPNQLLQLVLPDPLGTLRMYEPVVVSGTLLAEETKRDLFVVDGPVPMWSAWKLEAESVSLLMAPGQEP